MTENPKNILVVEDDTVWATFYKKALEESDGFHVHVARSVEEAQAYLTSLYFSVVITDGLEGRWPEVVESVFQTLGEQVRVILVSADQPKINEANEKGLEAILKTDTAPLVDLLLSFGAKPTLEKKQEETVDRLFQGFDQALQSLAAQWLETTGNEKLKIAGHIRHHFGNITGGLTMGFGLGFYTPTKHEELLQGLHRKMLVDYGLTLAQVLEIFSPHLTSPTTYTTERYQQSREMFREVAQ